MDSAKSLSIPGRDLLRFCGAGRRRSRQLMLKHSLSENMRTAVALHSELSFSTAWWGRQ